MFNYEGVQDSSLDDGPYGNLHASFFQLAPQTNIIKIVPCITLNSLLKTNLRYIFSPQPYIPFTSCLCFHAL